jgi:hypothetical protein
MNARCNDLDFNVNGKGKHKGVLEYDTYSLINRCKRLGMKSSFRLQVKEFSCSVSPLASIFFVILLSTFSAEKLIIYREDGGSRITCNFRTYLQMYTKLPKHSSLYRCRISHLEGKVDFLNKNCDAKVVYKSRDKLTSTSSVYHYNIFIRLVIRLYASVTLAPRISCRYWMRLRFRGPCWSGQGTGEV